MVLDALFRTGGMVLGITLVGTSQESAPRPPVLVNIQDEKPTEHPVVGVGHSGPIAPTQHVQLQNPVNMMINLRVDNQSMHLGFIQTPLHIERQVMFTCNS